MNALKLSFLLATLLGNQNVKYIIISNSSVARGGRGGLEPPHWLVKYAKSHVFGAFEADFLSKIENTPPIGKQPLLKRLKFRFRSKNQSQFR